MDLQYIDKDFDHGDLLWSQIGEEYEEVTPYNFHDTLRAVNTEADFDNPVPIKQLFLDDLGDDIFDSLKVEKTGGDVTSNRDIDIKVLDYANKIAHTSYGNQEKSMFSNQQLMEIAVYKNMTTNPFFKHAVTDNLKAISSAALDIVKHNQLYSDSPKTLRRYMEWSKDHLLTEKEQQEMADNFEEMSQREGSVMAKAKRKRAKALCFLKEGTGKITVNRRDFLEYFHLHGSRQKICAPLVASNYLCSFDVTFMVFGSGYTGQAEACSLALAKAIAKFDPSTVELLETDKYRNLLKHNPKIVQSKTTGLYKARKKYPYKRR